jgi:hypothetical protein
MGTRIQTLLRKSNSSPNWISKLTLADNLYIPVKIYGSTSSIRVLIDNYYTANQPPTLYNITLTNANTQYSQAIPENTRQFRFRCRTSYDVRYAFATDKVATPTAPYMTLPAGADYAMGDALLGTTVLYLASAQAGVIVELECWS